MSEEAAPAPEMLSTWLACIASCKAHVYVHPSAAMPANAQAEPLPDA